MKAVLPLLGLAALAALSNLVRVPLFFGVEFYLGSVWTLVASALFGPFGGAFVAVVSGVATLPKTTHPFFLSILVLEGFAVGFLVRRLKGSLLLSAVMFWLVGGSVLIAIFYAAVMGSSPTATVLIWLKQSVNGIANALIATFIVVAIDQYRRRAAGFRVLTFQQVFFTSLVALTFIPALTILIMTSRARMDAVEREVLSKTRTMVSTMDSLVSAWQRGKLDSVNELARLAATHPAGPSDGLQRDTVIIARAGPGFVGMLTTDEAGRTVSSAVAGVADTSQNIGLDLSDRPFFQEIRAKRAPVVSPAFVSRGIRAVATVAFAVPIMRDGKFSGMATGAAALENLREALNRYAAQSSMVLTILDQTGAVIASTDAAVRPLDRPVPGKDDAVTDRGDGAYHRLPPATRFVPSMNRWEDSLYGVRQSATGLDWTLVAETPLQPYSRDLQGYYAENFATVLGLCLVGLAISFFLTRWIGGPIANLAAVTSHMPARVQSGAAIVWPASPVHEIATLIANLQEMTAAMAGRFQNLRFATEAADSANRAKSEFLANMSHEIRTPLGAVLGFTELLFLPETVADEREDYLRAIRRNGEQLFRLIDEVLDFSKVEAGHLRIDPVRVSFDELLAGSIDLAATGVRSKNLALTVAATTPLPASLIVDPTRLKQILLNVVGNAVKFTESGYVRVSFGAASAGEKYRLTVVVEDNGIGIDPTEAERLFQAFGQLDTSNKRRFGGTGLGLALSRRLARAMGGDIELVASARNQGCTFAVSVEVGVEPGTRFSASIDELRFLGRAERPELAPRAALDGLRLLVVEDAPDNRLLFSRALKRLGATVELAESGLEGVRKAETNVFDAILMDVQMPEIDGLEATRMLRRSGHPIPIVALTAHALPEDRVRCLQAGCNDYLTKPVDWALLADVVSRLVTRSRVL